ncbi:HpcH/HpaI aldolase/citrate lyase family protein [Catellatospora sichuanensis]|uniref:HpcH/HpaI aldolase/citrate lyase family protein n=1 Tax=Catellatospora sichuanensis TaxID=1969805 RepID=UPI001FEBEF2A|nr:CoA ester lyase [Catellatospora sichuanensis]
MRSYLYVPGDNPAKLAKALTVGADALIVDLEDAVPPGGKDAARAAVAAFLAGVARGAAGMIAVPGQDLRSGPIPRHETAISVQAAGGRGTGPDGAASGNGLVGRRVWVRVNPGELGHLDAAAVVGSGLAGLCVAKTESVEQLSALDTVLGGLERAAGLAVGSVQVVPLLESAAAVLAAPAIARGPRVARLQLGEADLAADLGVTLGPDERELLWARSQAVLASAAAGIAPPVAPVSVNFRDLDALRASTQAMKRLGFRGRACIHPAQLPVVHEVFTPTEPELAAARDLVDRHEQALRDGSGVCLDAHGRLVDEAVVRSARRLLAAD